MKQEHLSYEGLCNIEQLAVVEVIPTMHSACWRLDHSVITRTIITKQGYSFFLLMI